MGQRHSTTMSACCGGMAAPEQAACPPTPAAQPTPAAPPDDVLPTNSQRLEVAGSGDSAPAPDSPAAPSLTAVPNSPAAFLLATLPDDLLVACFEQLEDPLERRRVLPLVCSRWRRLADAPQLVCSFSLNLYGASALPRLAAFRGWLRQSVAAAAVRSLRLEARQSFACSLRLERFSADELEQLHSGLLQCAAACSGLRQLRVVMPKQWHFLPDVDVCSLAAGLPRLQLLHLSLPATRLVVEAPLVSLPQLLDLRLLGQPAWLGPAAALPPALTRLGLGEFDRGQEECPPQIGALSQLQHLYLETRDCEPAVYGALSRLGSLTALELNNCRCLPPPEALRPLINLQALAVSTWGDSAGLDAALQALPQLTALFLDVRPSLPPAVAGLAQLQRFVWDSGEPPASALPGGPWLSSLRKVALLCPMILSRIHVLQTATQLEHLGLASLYDAMQGDTYGLLLFAREHPTLQQLHLCAGLGVSSREVAAYVAGHTPRLSVSFVERRADLVRTVVPDLAEWL